MNTRTRFPPSPTGYMHIGSLRTALFNFLLAKKDSGKFILRIEDTDRERLVAGAAENIVKILKDFGLDFDEGPGKDGGHGPYVQSERLPIYQKYAQELLQKGLAYYCFCTTERLDNLRKVQEAQKLPPRFDGLCRDLAATEVALKLEKKQPFVIRFKMPRTGITEYDDLIYGKLQFKNDLQDDFVAVKTDGYPVYNFANVIDDHLMEITHILRGQEFLSSTPKHVQLYQAFGWTPPQFAHLPLILDTSKRKLAKRTGDVAVEEFLKKGYLKPALINFIVLLGWNPKSTQEIFSLEELVKEFSLDKINKAGAVFDLVKLDFIDREWRKKLNLKPENDPLFSRAKELLTARFPIDDALLRLVWPQILERIKGPSELEQKLSEFDFYFKSLEYSSELLVWKKSTAVETKKNLLALKEFLQSLSDVDFTVQNLETKTKSYLEERGVSTGAALWPLRAALSGQKNSPGPFEILEVFAKVNKEEIFSRIDKAVANL